MMLIELFLGEIVLCLIILVQLILNTQIIRNPENNFPILLKEMTCQIYVVLFFVIILIFNSKAIGFVPNNLFYCDQNTQQIKVLFLITILLTLPFIKQSLIIQKINYIEFDILLLLSTLASLLLISASDLLAVYVLIEMQSLCFYILASFKRNSVFSSEAGLKYFIFGSIMSCLFLLALGILYGVTGTLNFNDLSILCLFKYPTEFGLMLSISILLITILFLFKLAVVPFHFWAPDVYEGAPLASTIIFSILTKLILTHLFMKWIFVIGYLYLTIQHMLIVCGLASILIGSLLALKQKRLKILVIYSSIAQVGFIILSLSLNNYDGFVYCFFFLIIYILTSILIWGNLTVLQNSNNNYAEFVKQSTDSFFITDLKNLFEYNASWALMFVCIFFSIAGIPPFFSFLAKILILLELIFVKLNTIAVLVIILSSISIFYYIRIIKIIYFESNLDKWKILKKSQLFFKGDETSNCFSILVIIQTLLLILFFSCDYLIQICSYFVLNSLYF